MNSSVGTAGVGVGQAVGGISGSRRRRGFGASRLGGAGVNGDEGERRAVALQTGHVEVAARLVDARLAAVLRHHRLHGQAVALVSAVAASFTDPFVDHDAEVGLGELAAAAGPAILGGARLVVDQGGHATHRGESLLRLDQPRAIPDFDAVGERAEVGIAVGPDVVGRHDHFGDTFEEQLLDHARHVELTLGVLPAGHRHGAVVEQLERHVDAGGDGGAHGQRAGVEVRAVTEVLDDVLTVDERRHPDPLRTFVAHRREPGDVTHPCRVHQGDHRVASDPAADERTLGNASGDVVRAPAAEERRAVDGERDAGALGPHGQRGDAGVVDASDETGTQRGEQLVGVDRPSAGDQRLTVLVVASDDDGSLVP